MMRLPSGQKTTACTGDRTPFVMQFCAQRVRSASTGDEHSATGGSIARAHAADGCALGTASAPPGRGPPPCSRTESATMKDVDGSTV